MSSAWYFEKGIGPVVASSFEGRTSEGRSKWWKERLIWRGEGFDGEKCNESRFAVSERLELGTHHWVIRFYTFGYRRERTVFTNKVPERTNNFIRTKQRKLSADQQVTITLLRDKLKSDTKEGETSVTDWI